MLGGGAGVMEDFSKMVVVVDMAIANPSSQQSSIQGMKVFTSSSAMAMSAGIYYSRSIQVVTSLHYPVCKLLKNMASIEDYLMRIPE